MPLFVITMAVEEVDTSTSKDVAEDVEEDVDKT